MGISSADMVDQNLLDGGLINIHKMYQSNCTYRLACVSLDYVKVDAICEKIY